MMVDRSPVPVTPFMRDIDMKNPVPSNPIRCVAAAEIMCRGPDKWRDQILKHMDNSAGCTETNTQG